MLPVIAFFSTGNQPVDGPVLTTDDHQVVAITAESYNGITGAALRLDGGVDLPAGAYEIEAVTQADPHRLRLVDGNPTDQTYSNVGESLRGVFHLNDPGILYVERDLNRTILGIVSMRIERHDP